MSKLKDKGNFIEWSKDQIEDYTDLQSDIRKYMEKWNIRDKDTVIQEGEDMMVGRMLGFIKCNDGKHGWDCSNESETKFLEVKQSSWEVDQNSATFNDTTLAKALEFCEENTYVGLSVSSSKGIEFIVFGSEPTLGEMLAEKVKNRKPGSRSTPSMSIKALIEIGYDVCIPSEDKRDMVYDRLSKSRSIKKLLAKEDIKLIEDVKVK